MRQYFNVKLFHPNDPKGSWSGTRRFRVSEGIGDNGEKMFFAVAENFGCGKNAATPEAAIRSLARDSAATVLEIQPAKQE